MITEEQRAERIKYIGSSDAAGVLGLSRWKSPIQVWALKTGLVEPEDLSDKLAVEVGTELEDLCARLFEKRTGKKTNRVTQTVFHPNYPFLAANLDRRVVGEDAVLECKTAGAWVAKEWAGEEMPQEVIIQVMHQLAVTGKSYAYACILIGGNQDFIWKRIDRNPVLISELVRRECEFWVKFVEPKIMPTTVTKYDDSILFKLFPGGQDEEEIALGDEANIVADNLKAMQKDYKNLEDLIEKEKNVLRAMLKDHSVGRTDKYKISWSLQNTTRLDVKDLRAKAPEIFEKYAETKPSRVLRVSELKKQGA